MTVVGREPEVQHVRSVASGLLLVTGDSGIGKSALLRVARAGEARLCPSPREAAGYDGSLQSLLIEMLGEAYEAALKTSGVALVEKLGNLADKVSEAGARELTRGVAKVLLGFLRARVGNEAADVIQRVWADVESQSDPSLAARMQGVADLDTVRAVMEVAREVSDVAGDIHLLIDGGEKLTAADYALALELNRLLPSGVVVTLTHRLATAQDAERTRMAGASGIPECRIEPLRDEVVLEWCEQEGLPRHDARRVVRAAGGYPLFVDAAIGHLRSGGSLEELPAGRALEALTESAWVGLDPRTRSLARLLIGFPDPPPKDLILSLLKTDDSGWYTFKEDLLEARLFSPRGSGAPWFHERRRQILWTGIISAEERAELSDVLIDAVTTWSGVQDFLTPFEVLTVSELAEYASSIRGEPGVSSALSLTDLQLAILYSLLELMDDREAPEGIDNRFVSTAAVLDDARSLFDLPGDYIAELDELVSLNLAYVASNDNASILTAIFPSSRYTVVLLGLHIRRFGRMPMRSLATAAFEVAIRPLLGPFEAVVYGVGSGSITSIQKSLSRAPRPVHRFPSPPSLIVRWKWGHRDLYFGADFSDVVDRDGAATKIASMDGDLWGEPIEARVVESRPSDPVPGERFLAACRALAGRAHGWSDSSAPDWPSDTAVSAKELEATRSSMREFIRAHTSERERLAAGYDQARSYAVREDGGHALIVEFEGAGAGVRDLGQVEGGAFGDPLFSVRLARDLDLPGQASVRRMRTVSGGWRKAPAIEIAMEYQKACAEFNRMQNPMYLNLLDVDQIRSRVERAQEEAYADALALYEARIPILGTSARPIPSTIYSILVPGHRMGDVPSFTVVYFSRESDAPGFEYVVDQSFDSESGSIEKLLRSTFGSQMPSEYFGSWSVAELFFSRRLGYDRGAIRTWRVQDLLGRVAPQDDDGYKGE